MEAAWKAVLVESDRRCDLHNRVKEDLLIKVNSQLKTWQRENYHKVIKLSCFGPLPLRRFFLMSYNFSNSLIISLQQLLHLKEKKEMDEQFKKAQKPWSKLLLHVNKTKADYHAACKAEKTAVNIERNELTLNEMLNNSSLSQDHVSLMKGLKREL